MGLHRWRTAVAILESADTQERPSTVRKLLERLVFFVGADRSLLNCVGMARTASVLA